ncbi:MAG: hypothetical protein KGQ41_00575 [Alphaproteobacteria bacterium]|nr:hypothetical protein [Alphaproteobacteria bacterium]
MSIKKVFKHLTARKRIRVAFKYLAKRGFDSLVDKAVNAATAAGIAAVVSVASHTPTAMEPAKMPPLKPDVAMQDVGDAGQPTDTSVQDAKMRALADAAVKKAMEEAGLSKGYAGKQVAIVKTPAPRSPTVLQ